MKNVKFFVKYKLKKYMQKLRKEFQCGISDSDSITEVNTRKLKTGLNYKST